MNYKVIDPKGVLVGKDLVKKGENLPKSAHNAITKAFLRFGQIEAVKPAKKEAVKPPEK